MLTIETVSNGWIVRNKWNEDDESEVVYSSVISKDEDEIGAAVVLLWEIVETLGISGSRYDEWRIHISKKHGDKWENPNEKKNL